MSCGVAKKDRPEYVQNLVLDFFQEMEGPGVTVTLDTSLGSKGLGHTMVKRKTYRDGIARKLSARGCAMGTLKPANFADAKVKFVGDVSSLVEKDLV